MRAERHRTGFSRLGPSGELRTGDNVGPGHRRAGGSDCGACYGDAITLAVMWLRYDPVRSRRIPYMNTAHAWDKLNGPNECRMGVRGHFNLAIDRSRNSGNKCLDPRPLSSNVPT